MRHLLLALTAPILFASAPSLAAPPLGGGAEPTLTPSVDVSRLGPSARVVRDPATGRVRQVFGLSVAVDGTTPATRALAFLADYGALLGLTGSFTVEEVQSPRLVGASGPVKRHIVRLAHVHGGLRVEGRATTVTVDGDGRILSLTTDRAGLVPPLSLTPRLDPKSAAARVEALYRVTALPDNASLVIVAQGDTPARIAWKVPAAAVVLAAHFFVWVDAETGAIVRTAPAGPDQALATLPLRDPSEGGTR